VSWRRRRVIARPHGTFNAVATPGGEHEKSRLVPNEALPCRGSKAAEAGSPIRDTMEGSVYLGTPAAAFTAKHAVIWLGAIRRGSGTARRQSPIRRGQRGAKLHPGGRRRRSGGLPGIASMSRSRG